MNLFCCFRKKKSTDITVGVVLETVNVLVTEDRFTEMSSISDYSKNNSFLNKDYYYDDVGINDLMEAMIWRIEIEN
jgi:hypothetical protein